MKDEKRRSWVVSAAAVTVLAGLVAAFRGPIVTLILEPLAWLLWAGWRLLVSVDQKVWWLILASGCAVLVIRLFDAQLRLQDVGPSGESTEPGPGGRIEHWMDRAAGMRRGDGGREALRADLASMAALVAETTRTPFPPEWDREPSRARPVSPGVTAVERLEAALLHRLPGFRRRADERRIERLLNWMEAALEIRDDKHSQ
jgi:hypothetical protein